MLAAEIEEARLRVHGFSCGSLRVPRFSGSWRKWKHFRNLEMALAKPLEFPLTENPVYEGLSRPSCFFHALIKHLQPRFHFGFWKVFAA
jgi:hypothetical protein